MHVLPFLVAANVLQRGSKVTGGQIAMQIASCCHVNSHFKQEISQELPDPFLQIGRDAGKSLMIVSDQSMTTSASYF